MIKSKILVVEDEQIVAYDLRRSLEGLGYEVSIAENAEAALHHASHTAPDLVLLDIVLPGRVDGIAAAGHFQSLNIPIVYMTGYSDVSLFERAQRTRPFGYLTKPLQERDLNHVVQLALLKHESEVRKENEHQRERAALRESEERFRRVVEEVNEYSIFTLDSEGRVKSWNSGAERTMGYKAQDVIGQYYGLFFPKEDRDRNVPALELEEARISGSADDTRWLLRKNGDRFWAEGILSAIHDADEVVTGFTKINRDTTERRRIEEALKEREERLTVALQAARTGTWRWDLRTNADILDESLRKLFGLAPDHNFQNIEQFYAIVHPEEREYVIASFNRTLHEGTHLNIEFRVVWPDGSEHWLLDQGEVGKDEQGQPVCLTGACVDIHDRKQAEQQLLENEERFRLYASNVREYALLQLDPDGRIVSWNTGAERVLGYTEAEILGQFSRVLFTPEDRLLGEPEKELERARLTGRSTDDRWHIRKDGARFWASGILNSMADEKGRLRGFAKVMRDETERRLAEEQLRTSLHEKEVLLQEIHHRVKNNLQVINSLLRLQSQQIREPSTRGLFEEARNRVQAIAGIHELLYRSPDLARVDFGAYLNRLTRDLFSFFGTRQEQINLSIHVNDAELDVSRAIPCGLIVNELVTNALKHAFPDGRNGTIGVFLSCSDSKCTLAVEDNGEGLPSGFDWEHAKSLGLQLVRVLTKQLDGTVGVVGNPGTRFEISFPQVFS